MSGFNTHGEILSQIQIGEHKKSRFDLSHTSKRTGNLGYILPCLSKDCLPGDSINLEPNVLARFEPFAVNIMSDMKITHHSFYVPHRLVWDNWDTFLTGGKTTTFDLILPWFGYEFFSNFDGGFIKDFYDFMIPKLTDDSKLLFTTLFTHLVRYTVKDSQQNMLVVNPGGLSNDSINDIIRIIYTALFNGNTDDDTLTMFYFNTTFTSYLDTRFPALKPYIAIPTLDEVLTTCADTQEEWTNDTTLTNTAYALQYCEPVVRETEKLRAKALLRIFDWLVGVNSNLSYLGYPVLSIESYDTLFNTTYNDYASARTSARYNGTYFIDNTPPTGWPTTYPIDNGAQFFLTLFGMERSLSSAQRSRFSWKDGNGNPVDFDLLWYHAYANVHYNVLPLRAQYLVWYQHYRDQILDTISPECPTYDGHQSSTLTNPTHWIDLVYMLPLRLSSWQKDIFNTCSPTSVRNSIMLSTTATTQQDVFSYYKNALDTSSRATKQSPVLSHSLNHYPEDLPAAGLSLESIDKARRVSRFLDKIYMVGYEMPDFLWSMFGVRSADARVQRSEFLGGDTQQVQIQPLTNNTSTSEQVAGSQTSLAQGFMQNKNIHYYAEESGTLITNVRVLPQVVYPYQIDRTKLFSQPLDFPFPDFADLGMDIITRGEIVCNPCGDYAERMAGFGYTQRYPNYKHYMDNVGGEFAYNSFQDLYIFKNTQADQLTDLPKLNISFGLARFDDTPFIVFGNLSHVLKLDVYFNMNAERILPLFMTL